LAKYLQDMNNKVVYIGDGRKDSEIVRLAVNMDAYLVTADNGMSDGDMSFREYHNTYLVKPDKKFKYVWRDLYTLMRNEIDEA
jgi:hypothetical protein